MKSNIKILHVINSLNTGGAELLLLNICTGLKNRYKNFTFIVTVLLEKGCLSTTFENNGIEIIFLDLSRSGWFKRLLSVYKVIKKNKPDIVHTHLLLSDIYGLIAAFLAGVRLRVSSVHNMYPNLNWKNKVCRRVVSILATKIIAVSNVARDYYLTQKYYPERKIKIIHNAPSFEVGHIKPKRIFQEKPIIKLLNVGRFIPEKGQIYLVRAMEILQRYSTNFQLDIYGDGIEETNLLNEINRLGLRNVFIKGITSDMKTVYADSDILISASFFESGPLVIIEAISMGIPVIATDIPSHREMLNGMEEMFLIKPGNPLSISQAVIQLLNNTDLYYSLSRKEIEHSKKYSVSNLLTNYSRLYNSLLLKRK